MKLISLVFPLCLACGIAGGQETEASSQSQSLPSSDLVPAESALHRALDVAGYINFRYLNEDDLAEHRFYREYAASLFLSKTIGAWRFHAEFNADTAPEYDSEGIHLLPQRPSLSVKLDSAFVNYNARDWLQLRGGFLFIPTYWRTHRYQSTTLTVDEPLIDQNVFPTAIRGGMVYGDRYFAGGGISYAVYGGIDQQSEFDLSAQTTKVESARAVGGKVTLHVPNRQVFDTFDLAFHRLHRVAADGRPDEINGGELLIAKGRAALLSEFAHASVDIADGKRVFLREGFYFQPSWRIRKGLFGVARYDRLDRDSRFASENRLARQSAGVTWRPVSSLSLKMDGNRFEPASGRLAPYYGVTAAVVYFFQTR